VSKKWIKNFTFLLLCAFAGNCFAQSLSDLQLKKQKAEQEIEFTNQLLKETQKSQNVSLEKVKLLNLKISKRNALITDLRDEIAVYQGIIEDNTEAIAMLEEDVENLKKEYTSFILSAYRNRNAGDKLILLLSAESFNQAYRRLLYLKRYALYRNDQAEAIKAIRQILEKSAERLEQQKKIHQQLVNETQQENKKLAGEKEVQNIEVQKLQKKQRELMQRLNAQKKIEQRLEAEIQRIIEEEARKSGAKPGNSFAMTPEQKLIGSSFEQNKARLPWPVEKGIITEKFGINPHPVLTHVDIKNNGINITTEPGSRVRAVFNGEVTRIFGIAGGNTSVIIRHGNYLSVYSNLREVTVKKGDKVSTRQNIGIVFTDSEDGNKSILKFQIWRDSQKLNPEEWISK
jgi:septal ring factor EnvC (AmiA/AmiB activator)